MAARDPYELAVNPRPRGESHYRAKLTEADVRAIRELARRRAELIAQARALSTQRIADAAGVSKKCVENVIYGTKWNHVQ